MKSAPYIAHVGINSASRSAGYAARRSGKCAFRAYWRRHPGANMLNYLRKSLNTRSPRNVPPATPEGLLSSAAQLALGQQGDLLQFVLDRMAEGVIVCDRDFRMVQF